MLIQIHILQNYAPSNLNRDDTGAPKDAIFGGVRRGRISSQCLKRSIRRSDAFTEAFKADGLLGMRTQLLPDLVRKELEALGVDEKSITAIIANVPKFGRESSKKGDEDDDSTETESVDETVEEKELETKTKQLIFLAPNELAPFSKALLDLYQKLGLKAWDKAFSKKEIKKTVKALGKRVPRSVDIAMFGRMTTSEAFEDVQAAVQVAHAISTHALASEFDYFTAVDDLSGQTGAGMIGDVAFNSATYYKYLNIHWQKLVENLGGDLPVARKAVLALVAAAATAQPTGKQNTFAAFNLPDLMMVEVSGRNLPVSYANAFLQPVRAAAGDDLMARSIAAFGGYVARVGAAYSLDAQRAFFAVCDADLPNASPLHSLEALQNWLAQRLPVEG